MELLLPMISPLLRTEGLALAFDDGQTQALAGVDLSVAPGELLAIVGASGCGKSSLLSLVGRLEQPSAGECYFRGIAYRDITDAAAFRRRHIGLVFQSFHLLPTLSVLDNVLVPTLDSGEAPAAVRQRALDLLERLGLSERLQHRPTMLSGGERQQVAIARALINSPDLLLADEPTGSLDSANAAQVLDLLGELQRERQLTVLLVTHDAAVAARADRIVHMRDGRLCTAVAEVAA